MPFPSVFQWGVATAAYQNEGSAARAGGGLSVWDMLCRQRGRIFDEQSGHVACDHVKHWQEDVDLVAGLGAGMYRFSISWPRVLPEGVGRVNEEGMAFYERLVDALLARGVRPFITMHHWDLPYELFCRGGWLNRDSADWFAEYATLLGKRLGDRARLWATFNEMSNIAIGYAGGGMAPGIKLGRHEVFRVMHHLLVAHGRGTDALRAAAGPSAEIGVAHGWWVGVPAGDSPEDLEAARAFSFSVGDDPDSVCQKTAWYADPILRGQYPADGLARCEEYLPAGWEKDMPAIHRPQQCLGLNLYMGCRVRGDSQGGFEVLPLPAGHPLNRLKWPILPEVMYYGPVFAHQRYGLPIRICENGAPGGDRIARDGKIHDADRIDFLAAHIAQLRRAVEAGIDVRSYCVWTLMDNFEWAAGYDPRFGLVHVDFQTQKRTPKDSYHWYQHVIEGNGGDASLRAALS